MCCYYMCFCSFAVSRHESLVFHVVFIIILILVEVIHLLKYTFNFMASSYFVNLLRLIVIRGTWTVITAFNKVVLVLAIYLLLIEVLIKWIVITVILVKQVLLLLMINIISTKCNLLLLLWLVWIILVLLLWLAN